VANPNPPLQNLKPWKPGETGNPAGYSKGRRATDNMLKLIDKTKGADELIAQMWLKSVLKGDFKFFKEYLERTEGKVKDAPEDNGDTSVTAAAMAKADEIRKRRAGGK
jgi:hypothetical protein